MTVYFNKHRGRWSYHFEKDGKRYRGYCLDALGAPVTSRSAAKQAEGVARRRVELEPKIAKPDELTMALAIAALVPVWRLQASWPARQLWIRDIIGFFGADTGIGSIDQARVDDYASRLRTSNMMTWAGGPGLDPGAETNAAYWKATDKPRSAATINLYLGTLRQIIARAGTHRDQTTGLPVFNWLPKVPHLRRPKRKPRPMPDQVSAEIMAIMPAHIIDAMMLTAMFGFRSTEAFTLKRTHIDWDHGGIRLLAEEVKDAEDIFLPASQFALGYLWCLDIDADARGVRDLISWQPKKDGAFVAIKKPRGAWRRARAFMAAKYGRTWRWHDLRGAFISHVAQDAGGVMAQELARHSSFATTQLYIEVADEMRRIAADRISDRAQQLGNSENRLHEPLTDQFAARQGRRTDKKPKLKSVG